MGEKLKYIMDEDGRSKKRIATTKDLCKVKRKLTKWREEFGLKGVIFTDITGSLGMKSTDQSPTLMDATDAERALFSEIMYNWGVEGQILMFMEEAGEALQALSKLGRGRSSGSESDLAEEFADLTLMMKQLIYCFGIENIYREKYAKKLIRITNRLEKRPECYRNSSAMYMTCATCEHFDECVSYFESEATAAAMRKEVKR